MRKGLLFSFCFAFLIFTVSLSSIAGAVSEEGDVPVSHGIYLLAEEGSMAMAGIRGNDISFEADDFARAMNLSGVRSITITEVPPTADGELLVGSTVVNPGQTISAQNIAHMRYASRSDTSTMSYFRFKVGESAYDVKCELYMLDKPNSAPTLSVATETSLNVSTHRNIRLYGTLPCYDPDGDKTIIEIVSYASCGSVEICDREAGTYVYTPNENYSGKDCFTYVARDKYGNYSASKTVNLVVSKPTTSVVYADMIDSPMYNSALSMTEAGIMSGTQVGGQTYFYPTNTVSRAEFLVMAMNSIGITEVTDRESTVFADDADIPQSMKGYVAAAYELGYIKGTYVDSKLCFLPNEDITRAEAAVVICNMIDAVTPTVTPVFEDSDKIPAFAASAVNSLSYMGILTSENGNILPTSALTRADTAHLLCLVMQISD